MVLFQELAKDISREIFKRISCTMNEGIFTVVLSEISAKTPNKYLKKMNKEIVREILGGIYGENHKYAFMIFF